MYSTAERGRIELQVTSKEEEVEVLFNQGGESRLYHVSNKLFEEAKLPSKLRSLHAVLECLIQESKFDIEPTQPRRRELNRFLSSLSQSPHEEFRRLGKTISPLFIDDQSLLVVVFVLTVIVLIVVAILSLK